MKGKILIGLLVFVLGCATAQSYTKPGVNFSNFKKIAVIKFDCPTSSVAQEVADIIGLEFIKRGFNVIERSQLRAIVTEEELIQSGLIESNRAALKISGVNAILVGSVSRYDCHPDKVIMFLMGSL
jgi:curli biogenesis system outer membrane secretion channel CsgG